MESAQPLLLKLEFWLARGTNVVVMYAFRKDEPGYDILGAPGGLGRVGPQRTPEGYRCTGIEYRGPPWGRAAMGQNVQHVHHVNVHET